MNGELHSSDFASPSASVTSFDEQLYSRQMYVLGAESMGRVTQCRVFLSGLFGLGVEIAKNLILSGVRSITLHDNGTVSVSDLASQFYLSEADVGRLRVEACCGRLADLNAHVSVRPSSGAIDSSLLMEHDVVIFVNYPLEFLVEWNDICREHGIRFIATEARGLCGYVFDDFGDSFVVNDTNGEEPAFGMVTSISNDACGSVTIPEEKVHNLSSGDVVTFVNVEGMEEVNGREFRVTVTGPSTFTIGSTEFFHPYTGGGYFQQRKEPYSYSFKRLSHQLEDPSFVPCGWAKLEEAPLLHLAFRALHTFQMHHNLLLPNPTSESDIQEVVNIAAELQGSALSPAEERIARLLATTSTGNLSPVCTFIGGIASQEALKAAAGKYTPISQFLYFEAFECLPEKDGAVSPGFSLLQTSPHSTVQTVESISPLNRYIGQEVIFGKEFQDKLRSLHFFIVGAGALGCEMLKMFALMGVGCSSDGKIVITDMDSIEMSNLSRQFLFRQHHISMSKSSVAADAAREMNPDLNVLPLQDRVAPETESLFDTAFWESLDGVANALDNVEARRYVDSKCIEYKLPLLESGTLGTKANVQVIIPHSTLSYSSTVDPPDPSIPVCTLKNFPYAIEHTIQWARDLFEGLFVKIPECVNSFVSKPDFLEETRSQSSVYPATLSLLYESLVSERPVTLQECVVWARRKFDEIFVHQIIQLTHSFPHDALTSSGQPFWGGTKKFPHPQFFDREDAVHLDFVVAAASLRATTFHLHGSVSREDVYALVEHIHVPEFRPREDVKIASTEQEAAQTPSLMITPSLNPEENSVAILESKLPNPSSLAGFRLEVIEFEKDDDSNFHIDFINAASNIRARNYRIPEVDRNRTKMIAGKIIPAMVTTTAMAVGLVGIEMYKVIQKKKMESHCDWFLNSALAYFDFSEPSAAPKAKYNDREWTLWDTIDVFFDEDITLKRFIEFLKSEYGLTLQMLSCGQSLLFSFFMPSKKLQERLATPVASLYQSIGKADLLPSVRELRLEALCNDLKDEQADIPTIRYRFR